MNVYDVRLTALRGTTLAMVMLLPSMALACCPSDDNGEPKASQGLGETLPRALDLAADPAWRVYEFERGGIRYTQINDNVGGVRAAVGRIGDVQLVLPIGRDADHVLLPGDALPPGNARVLLRSKEVEVILIESGAMQYWWVRALNTAN